MKGLFWLRIAGYPAPIGDIANIVNGFYVGYCETKGMNFGGPVIETYLKYGFVASTAATAPIFIKLNSRKIPQQEQKQVSYVKSTSAALVLSTLETAAGYYAGSLWGKLN